MKLTRISLHAAFCLLLLMGFAGGSAAAASSNSKSSSSSSKVTTSTTKPTSPGNLQGYGSDGSLQDGSVVQLDKTSSSKVVAASDKNMQGMYGVTVDRGQLSLTVESDLPNEVYVATSGTYQVLVSNQNGVIKSGDYVTISAVDGIAMKAGTKDQQPMVLGRAAGNFDGKANVLGQVPLKNTNGSSAGTADIGLLSVAIDIKPNPNVLSTKTNLPPFLQKIGQEIARKQVSPLRMYISIAVTGMTIIVALVVLYAGVRSAVMAIGRNPLSKKSIFRGLAEVILTGFIILIIGLFAVYLLLKL